MRVIIIEDELLAQANLEHLLARVNPGIVVVARLGSVKDTLFWLASNEPPDLAFVDIQLSDDHSFEIFRRFEPTFPLVFTTAYDKYVLQSFEYNSIDYLLKPITEEKLRHALDKMKKFSDHFTRPPFNLGNLMTTGLRTDTTVPATGACDDSPGSESTTRLHEFPNRIVARKGNQYVIVPIDQVAYFFTTHKIVFLKDLAGKQMIVDKNLAALEASLNPRHFIRLNRKYVVAAQSIIQYVSVQGKLRVQLGPDAGEEVFVSKESAPGFRLWIGQHA